MKKLNILVILMVLILSACNNKNKKEDEEVLPTYINIDGYYSSSGKGFNQLNNGIVYFKCSDPQLQLVVQTANTETRTGTFPITHGSFTMTFPYKDLSSVAGAEDMGTVTITKNTEHYIQGTYIYKSSKYNTSTNTWGIGEILTGTFSGNKN